MLRHIRKAVKNENFLAPMDGIVEVDDTYIRGRENNKHASKRTEGTLGRSLETKEPVIGMVERKTGKVKAEQIAHVDQSTVEQKLLQHVNIDSRVISDEWKAYKKLKEFYRYESASHSHVRGGYSHKHD